MQCKNAGCRNKTEARNGKCPNCWEVQKRLKLFLQTDYGMQYLQTLLHDAFGLKLESIDDEREDISGT